MEEGIILTGYGMDEGFEMIGSEEPPRGKGGGGEKMSGLGGK